VKRRLVLVALVLVAAVPVFGVLTWRSLVEAPPASGHASSPMEFRVEEGEGFASVAGRLEHAGLVLSATRFKILARLRGADRSVQTGTYRLGFGTDPRRILDDLVEGRVRLRRLTLPEGFRLNRIVSETEAALEVPADSLEAALAEPRRTQDLGLESSSLEGYLYPDTYFFPDGTPADRVIDAFVSRFEEVWATLTGDLPDGFDRHDVVTLASIVEAETPLDDEKPRVAAVYLNRIRDGWLLQADPTVRYGIGRFTGRLYYKHLDIDTPYNTYMHRGLPPGPICSPGRAALQAVLTPTPDCEDFYFVASGRGGHDFSRTIAEHDAAVQRLRDLRDGVGTP
jgi:UPF0755 protein